MSESHPTIRDVAREASVSAATASLALRNDPRLRKATCLKVQEVAERLGYRANAVVSELLAQLRTSRTPKYQATLGAINASDNPRILEEIETFRDWASGYRQRAAQLGYGIDDFWLHEADMSPHRLATIFRARNIRGVIIVARIGTGKLPAGFDEIWEGFACVVLGVRNVRPLIHTVCNDQFSTARHAFAEAVSLGYRKPALVIGREIDDLVEGRFSGGFLGAQQMLPANRHVPPFTFSSPLNVPAAAKIGTPAVVERFGTWFQRHTPDIILCIHPEIREWVSSLGMSVPKDIGLIHLDQSELLDEWAGMRQNNTLVGAAGVDMLVGHLHRNELGIPSFPKCMTIESSWVTGKTVRATRI